ncbi:DUF4250 domain-containing protein [Oribacterium sp. HCP28S3_H8]|uniref:DUF4250 domain-containing protein n=1 Tax=Oribacterium sp. HCP28S3_H8 TaxID=3438945 RepID=UPI003062E5B0|nr:DUF4250 domain-containing protein [Oribacterium sp.]
MSLPKDPYMLLSYVNTKLRDEYASLSEFADQEEIDLNALTKVLAAIDYHYDENLRQFR